MPQNNRTGNRKRLTAFMLVLLSVVLLLAACGNNDGSDGGPIGGIHPGDIVAKYDGGEVTGKELIAFLGAHKFFNLNEMYGFYEMLPSFKQDMLYQLIAIRLITADATDAMRKASADIAGEEMTGLKQALDEDAEYKSSMEQFLSTEGITLDDLENYMVMYFNLQSVLDEKFSEEEIRTHYESRLAEDPNAFLNATVRHVLVSLTDSEGNERSDEDALARAKEAQAKLKNGGDWVAIAKEYSDDPGSRDNGGQYVDVPVAMWVENFKKHAIEQPVGEVGEPFLTEHGYHVMVVEERRQAEFADLKVELEGELISDFFVKMIEEEVPALVTEINLPEPEMPEGFE